MDNYTLLKANGLNKIRTQNSKLVSYNIEMTEITGGTFWKKYTDSQIECTKKFKSDFSVENFEKLQEYYNPIDLKNPRLRYLAKEPGTVWVRVSGTWENKTYYDFDNSCNVEIPD